jgi:hypothetical protein
MFEKRPFCVPSSSPYSWKKTHLMVSRVVLTMHNREKSISLAPKFDDNALLLPIFTENHNFLTRLYTYGWFTLHRLISLFFLFSVAHFAFYIRFIIVWKEKFWNIKLSFFSIFGWTSLYTFRTELRARWHTTEWKFFLSAVKNRFSTMHGASAQSGHKQNRGCRCGQGKFVLVTIADFRLDKRGLETWISAEGSFQILKHVAC